MNPDFVVYSPSNQLLLVVEVKATRSESPEWAAKFRRNLIAHGAIPDAPFFLLILPEHAYLWKNALATQEAPPTFVTRTKNLLDPYLSRYGDDYSALTGSSLELAVRSWLNDLANPNWHSQASEDQLLTDSGLAAQIRDGAVSYGDVM
jgi:hypothetical protein